MKSALVSPSRSKFVVRPTVPRKSDEPALANDSAELAELAVLRLIVETVLEGLDVGAAMGLAGGAFLDMSRALPSFSFSSCAHRYSLIPRRHAMDVFLNPKP